MRAPLTRAELFALLLATLALGNAVAAAVAVASGPPRHEARVELLVGDERFAESEPQYRDPLLVAGIAEVYARLATSPSVIEQVSDRLDLELSVDDLAARIRTSTAIGSPFFAVIVQDSDPGMAASIANEIAAVLSSSREGSASGPQRLSIVEPALPQPASSGTLRVLAAAAAGGLALTMVLAARYLPRDGDQRTDRRNHATPVSDDAPPDQREPWHDRYA